MHINISLDLSDKMGRKILEGRRLSADSEAAGAVRVMPPCMGMGQAAGTAAALACKEGADLRRLDTEKLKAELIKNNVKL